MHAYQYRAINRHGKINTGIAEAISTADLESRLGQIGLDLINCRKRRGGFLACMRSGITRRDLIILCYHLEQTCRAGVPILDGLSDLRDTTENSRLRDITAAMISAIEAGRTLAGVMQDHPAVFNGIFCSLVRTGEQSGDIAQVFSSIGENLKWQDEQAALTKKLLAYPLFAGAMVIVAVFFLMIYLVPEMLQFVRVMGQEMPLHTKALLVVSHVLVNYWHLFLLLPLLLAVAVYAGINLSPGARYFADAVTLRLPLVGSVCKKIILARLTRFMAMMYASGITLIDCIRACEKIAGNRVFENGLHGIGQSLVAGYSLSSSFAQSELFPPLALRMIRVGEKTGTLEKSLLGICYFYTRDARESIERLQTMIEPAMTLLLGGVIGWVMFSILGPIYDLIAHIRI